ncbi:MAG TPA: ATP-binding protein, partial [Mycobacteriales bacterium]|nr:ATP-binding protein [Mycobacteriales bacterium]
MSAVLSYLPRGNTLSDEAWNKRHLLLQWLLLLHVPALFVFGLARGYQVQEVAATVAVPFALLIVGRLMHTRRLASFFVTAGLFTCSAALVGLSGGAIEAHFHFFIMIGFIALYQDWIPFLANIIFTVLSHGFGSAFKSGLMFNHADAVAHPWRWSLLHGLAVLAASIGVVLFWKQTEDEQQKTMQLREQLANSEISRRRFTSDMLVNLARRNQNLLYRQLDLINQLEEHEQDPDALADLFQLDHLATRIRRNAENLLVLSGEEPARKWGRPVPLADVVRAAIAETEDLDRVDFAVDESLAVSGRVVSDLTHLLAEIIENAVHFSPPAMSVMLRSRTYHQSAGAQVLSIEDWGVGMTPQEMAEANELLAAPREVDLSVSQRLGLHVVARLAQRYRISVSLTATPGGGVTAVVVLPPELFDLREEEPDFLARRPVMPVAPPSRPAAALESAPLMPPIEPTRTVTFAAPVPAIAGPPPAQYGAPEPFSTPGGVADEWHSWWTPQEKANGSPGDEILRADYAAPRSTPPAARTGHLDELRPGPSRMDPPAPGPLPSRPAPSDGRPPSGPARPGLPPDRPSDLRPSAPPPGPTRPGPGPGPGPADDRRTSRPAAGPPRPGLDDLRPDQTGSGPAWPGQTGPDPAWPSQARPDPAWPSQAGAERRPEWPDSNAGSAPAGADRPGLANLRPEPVGPDQTWPDDPGSGST